MRKIDAELQCFDAVKKQIVSSQHRRTKEREHHMSTLGCENLYGPVETLENLTQSHKMEDRNKR